jgi:hypothetical protein
MMARARPLESGNLVGISVVWGIGSAADHRSVRALTEAMRRRAARAGRGAPRVSR